jgi:hypothetical protein
MASTLNCNSVSTAMCKFPLPMFCILFVINEMSNRKSVYCGKRKHNLRLRKFVDMIIL